MARVNNLKLLFSRKGRDLRFQRGQRKCSCIRGQIMQPETITAENQYACHDLSVLNKRQKSHLLSQSVEPSI